MVCARHVTEYSPTKSGKISDAILNFPKTLAIKINFTTEERFVFGPEEEIKFTVFLELRFW